MKAGFSIDAIRCQVDAIVNYALAHDEARLFIRGMFRGGLAAVERDGSRVVSIQAGAALPRPLQFTREAR